MAFKGRPAPSKRTSPSMAADHVLRRPRSSDKRRAVTLFDLYDKTEQDLGPEAPPQPSATTTVCGIYPGQRPSPEDDPLYGKKLFEQRFGKALLLVRPQGAPLHRARLDRHHQRTAPTRAASTPRNSKWARGRPRPRCLRETPIIVSVHIPLVTAYLAYMPELPAPPPHHSLSVANANQVLDLFAGHKRAGRPPGPHPRQRNSNLEGRSRNINQRSRLR